MRVASACLSSGSASECLPSSVKKVAKLARLDSVEMASAPSVCTRTWAPSVG